jgi:hypothetical protein
MLTSEVCPMNMWVWAQHSEARVQVTLHGLVLHGRAEVVRFGSDPDLLGTALTRYIRDFPGVRRPLAIQGDGDHPDPASIRAAAATLLMVRIALQKGERNVHS